MNNQFNTHGRNKSKSGTPSRLALWLLGTLIAIFAIAFFLVMVDRADLQNGLERQRKTLHKTVAENRALRASVAELEKNQSRIRALAVEVVSRLQEENRQLASSAGRLTTNRQRHAEHVADRDSVRIDGTTRIYRSNARSSLTGQPRRVAENGSYNGQLNRNGVAKTVYVRGYWRKDGTYVRGHYRSPPGSNPR